MNLSKERAKQVVFVLEEADRLLVQRGWCKYKMYQMDGSVCLVGALNLASARVHPDARMFALGTALDILRGVTETTVAHLLPTWNDDPERTVEDVHLALKRGIERVEEMVR